MNTHASIKQIAPFTEEQVKAGDQSGFETEPTQ